MEVQFLYIYAIRWLYFLFSITDTRIVKFVASTIYKSSRHWIILQTDAALAKSKNLHSAVHTLQILETTKHLISLWLRMWQSKETFHRTLILPIIITRIHLKATKGDQVVLV